jgi:3-phosphoshikimate 1-carboxyvinyltransferase
MRIEPARAIRGTLRLPGDKSISHRAAIIAALARGRSRLTNFATSRDCASTLEVLRRLGIAIEQLGADVIVTGAAGRLRAPSATLDCGNSGTTMRLLAGVLAWQNFDATLDGDDSLRTRPMRRITEPLTLMNARIEGVDSRAPLAISGRAPLAGITYELPVASAQVKSCVLLAGLGAQERTTVIERTETRDHTERLLRFFGADAGDDSTPREISVDGATTLDALAARDLDIPGDISSAAFFIAAATLLPASELHIEHVGMNPTRTEFPHTLARLGADITFDESVDNVTGEPAGRISVRGAAQLASSDSTTPHTIRGAQVARLIDELPMLAVIATQTEGGLTVRDAAELRVKETDRITATLDNLRRMGAEVEEYADGFTVYGRTTLRGAMIDSFGDHRIAMAFAVAALIAHGASELRGAEAVAVSFPEFFELLERIVER